MTNNEMIDFIIQNKVDVSYFSEWDGEPAFWVVETWDYSNAENFQLAQIGRAKASTLHGALIALSQQLPKPDGC